MMKMCHVRGIRLRQIFLLLLFFFVCFFFFKQKKAYEIRLSLVGSELCIRARSGAMPDVLDGVAKAVQQASEVARHLLPSSIVGGEDNARMAARMEQIDQVCVCVHAQFTA